MATTAALVRTAAQPRRLYLGLAALAVVIAAVGFWPTYFGPLAAGTVVKTPIVHFHAAVYVGWLAIFVAQAALAATGSVAAHMQLGRFAIWYGVLLIVVGLITAFARFALRVRAGEVADAQAQLLGPVLDMLVFAPVFAAALCYRRKPDVHKRLMVVATTSLLIAAAGRMQFLGDARLLLVHLIWMAPILVAITHDLVRERRVHPVYVLGLAVLTLEGPLLRRVANDAEPWRSVSEWFTTWVA